MVDGQLGERRGLFTLQMAGKEDLYRFGLERASRARVELWDAWKVLEAKAHAFATIGGVFVAGAFAYITQAADKLGTAEKVLLLAAMTLLAASLWQAVRAIRVSYLGLPSSGVEAYGEIGSAIARTAPPNSYAMRLEAFLNEYAESVAAANDEMSASLGTKASYVRRCQTLLLIAVAVVMLLVAVSLFSPRAPIN